MTNQQCPITPPPELVKQWINAPHGLGLGCHSARSVPDETYAKRLIEAAQWGADQELEACCEWLNRQGRFVISKELRAARRPKPLTLNSIALQMLGTIERDAHYLPEITDTIRRALEALHNPPQEVTAPKPQFPPPRIIREDFLS